MNIIHFPAADRGSKDIGWLKSKFFFSFSDYYDPIKSAFGTLLAFNDDILEEDKGFGIHPHVNMEIISILLEGKMNHKDSMGYSTIIEEGGVQIMSAGSGLRHEEYNIGTGDVAFLQIWIQPKLQNIDPRYQLRHFPKKDRENKLVTIVSSEEGLGHCWINQNTKISIGYYTRTETIEYHFSGINKCIFIFLIKGGISLDGIMLKEKDGIGVWNAELISINVSKNAEFLIIETPVNQK